MSDINRMYNSKNPYQGKYKRVLCVCSAGLLRSPTAAFVLANEPFNYNTRAAGLDDGHALILVDDVLLEWADEIVCMTHEQYKRLRDRTDKPIVNLEIKDGFAYRDKRLVKAIKLKYSAGGYDAQTINNEATSSEGTEDPNSSEPEGC